MSLPGVLIPGDSLTHAGGRPNGDRKGQGHPGAKGRPRPPLGLLTSRTWDNYLLLLKLPNPQWLVMTAPAEKSTAPHPTSTVGPPQPCRLPCRLSTRSPGAQESEISLGNRVRPCLKKQKQTKSPIFKNQMNRLKTQDCDLEPSTLSPLHRATGDEVRYRVCPWSLGRRDSRGQGLLMQHQTVEGLKESGAPPCCPKRAIAHQAEIPVIPSFPPPAVVCKLGCMSEPLGSFQKIPPRPSPTPDQLDGHLWGGGWA